MSLVDSAAFGNYPDLSMTREAVKICTPEQMSAIVTQLGDNHKMSVFVDFSLPKDWLYFIQTGVFNFEVHAIHGGIAPDGSVST